MIPNRTNDEDAPVDAGGEPSRPEKVSALLKKPIEGMQQLMTHPIEGVQQVMGVLKEPRGMAFGWAASLILALLCYLIDLGAGSVWNNHDAQVVLAALGLREGSLTLREAALTVPPPTGVPLSLFQIQLIIRFFGINEAALRLLPVLAALGAALCLLTIAIDVGVGRHAGGLAGLLLLGMPLTYELSHRMLPDMMIAFACTLAVALTTHCLHGHKFDRHILPHHMDEEEPAPLPLRRWTMVVTALGVGMAAFTDPRAGVTALLFAILDILLSHRHLLRKRRVYLALGGGTALTLFAAGFHPSGPWSWLTLPKAGIPAESVLSLWRQGESLYARYIGQVVVVAALLGLLFGSLRRASRPLLAWAFVAIAMTWLGDVSTPPRGLGLVLPPVALCTAVGLETLVRRLGRLGMLVTVGALCGIVLSVRDGGKVLHRDDSIKALALSQKRAPREALLCTVGIPAHAPTLYSRRPVTRMERPEEVRQALHEDQPLSCMVPRAMVPQLTRLFAPAPKAAPPAPPARRPGPRRGKIFPSGADVPEAVHSVFATVLDIEEPPPDTMGPDVVLVSR